MILVTLLWKLTTATVNTTNYFQKTKIRIRTISSFKQKVLSLVCSVDVKDGIAGMGRVAPTLTGTVWWDNTGTSWHEMWMSGKQMDCYCWTYDSAASVFMGLSTFPLSMPKLVHLCMCNYVNDMVQIATSSFSLTTDKHWGSVKVSGHELHCK